jgi:adenylosuccinate lyase
MIERYENPEIARIWSDENKTRFWQDTELRVILAKAEKGKIPSHIARGIADKLEDIPIDPVWWKKRENETHHDLVAFVDERTRHLPLEWKLYFHADDMTSYDTEEPAFVRMLALSCLQVFESVLALGGVVSAMARKYRHTLMMGRTHGQGAELQTFGKECLTWLVGLRVCQEQLEHSASNLKYSKISGAVGNYGGIDPEVEKLALSYMGLEPFYGATQIMPRVLYVPVAQALCNLTQFLSKIAYDIRLGARSPRPIYQEPFGKKQLGSSAMPHKRNPIKCEQVEGLARLAMGYMIATTTNIPTWEERSIEQSSVERVAWPDLFHVTMQALKVMKGVLSGLQVYPDNMLWEIVESRGCYASGKAKELLAELIESHGLSREDAIRIIQLAAFNAYEPSDFVQHLRDNPDSLKGYEPIIGESKFKIFYTNIQFLIPNGELRESRLLDIPPDTIEGWNKSLLTIFDSRNGENIRRWKEVFDPSHLLRNEPTLFKQILGDNA